MIYENPSCKVISATYRKRVINNATENLNVGDTIQLIFWDKQGVLENNQLGVSSKVKISCERLPNYTPQRRDRIVIENNIYIVNDVSLRDQNPIWDNFWELTIKSKDINPNR